MTPDKTPTADSVQEDAARQGWKAGLCCAVEQMKGAAPAQPVAQQGVADGFFLLLPQRPKPEAPAGTVGLDWDAYSGAQMLAFGRDCSDAAIAALRTEQPAPATQQAGERVYAFRRKGLADFCTCDEARYEELSNKPHLFETRIFYTAPRPPTAQAADSVLEDAARYRWLRDEAHPDGVVNDDIHVHVDSPHYPNRWALLGPELDAAVDAARAAQKEKPHDL